MNYPVTSNSSVGHDDDLFNLLALNTLAEKAHERRYHAKPELKLKQSFRQRLGNFGLSTR